MLSSYIMVALFEKNISSTIQERRVRAKDLEKVLDKMLSLQVGRKVLVTSPSKSLFLAGKLEERTEKGAEYTKFSVYPEAKVCFFM